MNISALRNVMNEARKCAAAMLESGTYIEPELPTVRMDEPVRVATVELCSRLVGTKHDIIHELFELDELLVSGASTRGLHRNGNALATALVSFILVRSAVLTCSSLASWPARR